ncbi:hypothetical protein SAY86_006883 [Trapa natans]|uniref:Methyltransferase small domain-containing protein n=1 Tax=Trapa natans TaxID=22666 RepID=A0AAN7L6M2_TRANT|nr:hypothetical protein SAY86_006883 [Trapa natans]
MEELNSHGTRQMKVRLTGFGGLSTFIRPPLHRLKSTPCALSSSVLFSSSSPPASQSHQVPLFLRVPKYATPVSDLQKWYSWASDLAASVGSTFLVSDNGPDSSLLCRELRWLLEDALQEDIDPSLIHQVGVNSAQREVNLKTGIEDLYKLWIQRIEERRPFQYIVGCEHWRDLVLCVQEGVLIPRPETEIIIDLVADVISSNRGLKEGFWADLGTGSGAIAIGTARALGGCGNVIATDLSPVAVKVASFNVQRYGLQGVVEVREGSWFEPLKDVQGKLAGLVSNPPYIPSENIPGLQAEVGRHEPKLALDGGVDGMDHLLHLCQGAASMLRTGGFFALETNGEKQSKLILDYMEKEHRGTFYNAKAVPDFAGVLRFVTAFRV